VVAITTALRRHRIVGIDTSIFIYHIEANDRRSRTSYAALKMLRDGGTSGLTSILTIMELSVVPIRLGRADIVGHSEFLLDSIPNLTIVGLGRTTIRFAAELRARQ
jgi:hypothetical protein